MRSSPRSGGQTALNCTMDLARSGVLDQYGVEVLGASIDAIDAAEDRGRFKQVMEAAGLETPRAVYARSMAEAVRAARQIGYPVMIRPSFILGGGGTGHRRRRRPVPRDGESRAGHLAGERDPGRGVGGRAGRSSNSR